MVDTLLDQLKTNDDRLIFTIAICCNSHSATFDNACIYMSQKIAVLYPHHQPNSFGKEGCGGCRPHPIKMLNIKKRNGKTYIDGVDISEKNKYFSSKEFDKLGDKGRKHLYNDSNC